MPEAIPQWAMKRAGELSGYSSAPGEGSSLWWAKPVSIAFARYIAAHEEAPVDPFVECIRLILGGFEGEHQAQEYASNLRAVLANRALEIRPVSA